MNIYEKYAKAKFKLHQQGIKKSGRNDFGRYDYFELADFIPQLVKLEEELGFTTYVSFNTDVAELVFVNIEDSNDFFTVMSPMSTASLKGMHEVQNLGAVQTYIRRYLYVSAYEIVEGDQVDSTAKQTDSKITAKQLDALKALCLTNDKLDTVKAKALKDIYTSRGYAKGEDILTKDYESISKAFTTVLEEMKEADEQFKKELEQTELPWDEPKENK